VKRARVRYCKLCRLLVSRQVPALIVRVLINLYVGNFVRVQWCGIVSDYFLACNGVKQAISRAGVGCFVGSKFVGALVYPDDIVLLALLTYDAF